MVQNMNVGFLGKGQNTGAVTTLGRGGSDLTATVLGAALDLEEVQVWKVGECWGAESRAASSDLNSPCCC